MIVSNELKDTAQLWKIIQVPDISSNGSQSVRDKVLLRVDVCFMCGKPAEDSGQKITAKMKLGFFFSEQKYFELF